ncbi:unnamed protein product [Dovyalis caffra]|uniref:Uncharacterized protein n=1 Tax=Dovyalis caffra TaxID=77055 RepID=A0AAV1S510_9ROSI|nr:unnamed protein product [Dovyalis caffra]
MKRGSSCKANKYAKAVGEALKRERERGKKDGVAWVGLGIGGNNSAHEGMWGLLLEAFAKVVRVIRLLGLVNESINSTVEAFTWGRGTSTVFAVKVEVSISTGHVIRKD